MPSDIYLPFFTYGVFKPGELAFLRIKDIVAHCQASSIDAELRIRDGLPIASPNSRRKLLGELIHFCSGAEEEAYGRISELEPQKQYIWRVTNTALGPANYLQGRSPEKGSVIPDENVWNGREDPLFTVAYTRDSRKESTFRVGPQTLIPLRDGLSALMDLYRAVCLAPLSLRR